MGDDPEKGRAPARGDKEVIRLGELQLVGGCLFAAGQAPRLPEDDDASEVARIDAASIRADSRSVNAVSRASASSARPTVARAMPSIRWAYPCWYRFLAWMRAMASSAVLTHAS